MRFECFSVRNKLIAIDEALQIEKMNNDLKNVLWSHIYKRYTVYDSFDKPSTKFMEIFYEYHIKLPCTKIPSSQIKRIDLLDGLYETMSWNQVYDLVEFIYFFYQKIGANYMLNSYTKEINEVLERERSGYRLINGQITPITDEIEIICIKEAIEENLLEPAKVQIQEAISKLSDREHPDYRNSIKESISAVETICRHITNESTLDRAIPKLKNKGIEIPNILEDGMKKIYHFTNCGAGIRHALMDESINIGFEEAKYMLVICSAFVNYLKAKHAKNNI